MSPSQVGHLRYIMTREDEKRLIVLAAILRIGGAGTKNEVLDEIKHAGLMRFSASDLKPCATREELYWRNDLAQIRRHLVAEHFISNEKWNQWSITETGKSYFDSLVMQLNSPQNFQHLNLSAVGTIASLSLSPSTSDANALSGETELLEGQQTLRWSNKYERSPQLREAAIRIHGLVCMGCGFNFEEMYGALGAGFIEVHHTRAVSSLGGATAVSAANDLVVLCSNCHSVVHRHKPAPLSLAELQALVKRSNRAST